MADFATPLLLRRTPCPPLPGRPGRMRPVVSDNPRSAAFARRGVARPRGARARETTPPRATGNPSLPWRWSPTPLPRPKRFSGVPEDSPCHAWSSGASLYGAASSYFELGEDGGRQSMGVRGRGLWVSGGPRVSEEPFPTACAPFRDGVLPFFRGRPSPDSRESVGGAVETARSGPAGAVGSLRIEIRRLKWTVWTR